MNLSHLVTNYEPPSPRLSSSSSSPSERDILMKGPRSWSSQRLSMDKNTSSPFYPSSSSSYPRTHQLPLSPPDEEAPNKCSLPPISNLLQGADTISPSQPKRQRSDDWEDKSQGRGSGNPVKQRMVFPPTPPLRPGSSFESARLSPIASSSSPRSSIALPSLTSNNSSTNVLRHPSPVSDASSLRRSSNNSTSQHSNRSSISLSEGRYPSPANSNPPRFASPIDPLTNSAEYYSRSTSSTSTSTPATSTTPTTYTPPRSMVVPPPPPHHHHQMVSLANSAWQHHHYFPPSNTSSYPLNHDRYICRICHKAFSRPSSLRIHSHSHTGEKPFRCPHVGCGKAFSVRSNMKRHERGCHSARTTQQQQQQQQQLVS